MLIAFKFQIERADIQLTSVNRDAKLLAGTFELGHELAAVLLLHLPVQLQLAPALPGVIGKLHN